jgi:hypothetical protein
MVPQKIKNLTLEYGLLWNTIILKSEPPYYAFTLLHEHHLNKDECLKFKEVVEFKNETIMWKSYNTIGEVFEMEHRDINFSITY